MERPNGHVKRKRRNSQAYAQCCARRISTRLLQSSRQVLEQKERLPEQLSADRDTRVAVFNGDREELVNLLRKLKTDLPYNVCAKKYRLVQHRFSGPLTIPHDEGEMTAKDPLNQSIRRQRTVLAGMFQTVFQHLAATCAEVWRERDKLNEVLSVALKTMPNCKFLYAMNPKAVQISDNISSDGPQLRLISDETVPGARIFEKSVRVQAFFYRKPTSACGQSARR